MKTTRSLISLLALAIATASCADISAPRPIERVQSPTAQPSNGLLGGLLESVGSVLGIIGQPVERSVHVLRRTAPLTESVTITRTVGYDGGRIEVPGTGLTIIVPRGAVYSNTRITITALAGDQVAYEFGPHGLTFHRPLEVHQSMEGTYAENADPSYEAVYFGNGSASDDGLLGGLLGVVLELLNVEVDSVSQDLSFEVRHFSGYLVSSGRMEGSADEYER